MIQDHHEIACDCMLAADAQVFDLVDQIDDVELLQPALLEQPDLLLDPETEVALMERLFGLDGFLRARYGALWHASSRVAGHGTRALRRRKRRFLPETCRPQGAPRPGRSGG
jgi:hypothetical protein